ncbi:MAG: putative toxin-antitoxin system toxin component, PIN family [Clostridia bacterium]|nr:putative toxin-antitoxin system toxin component, PIN family [Clostridia bacterium]
MIVIADTNVFIDAIFHNDKDCMEILKREHKKELSFVMSNEMSEELLKTVFLHAIFLGCKLQDFQQPFSKIARALRRTIPFEPSVKLYICKDPCDNMFLECAVDYNVEYIISSDKDLLEISGKIKTKNKQNINILSPYDFINKHNLLKLKQRFR